MQTPVIPERANRRGPCPKGSTTEISTNTTANAESIGSGIWSVGISVGWDVLVVIGVRAARG
jgi:hypothetical protein